MLSLRLLFLLVTTIVENTSFSLGSFGVVEALPNLQHQTKSRIGISFRTCSTGGATHYYYSTPRGGLQFRGGEANTSSMTSLMATGNKPHHPAENNTPSAHRDKISLNVASPGMSNNDLDDNDSSVATSQGRLLLLIVALLYGTLNVALRLVYNIPMPDGSPMSASSLSAVRGWMATMCFVPLWFISKSKQDSQEVEEDSSIQLKSSETESPPMWMAALELAVWNFGAQGLLNVGLLTTGSARAAFLTQLSVVMTPIISIVAGQVVPPTVWIACVLALCGLVLLSGGGPAIIGSLFGTATTASNSVGDAAAAFGAGDLFILGGAFCWSLYLFRLTNIGKRYDDIQLQAGKTTLLAILYTIWFVVGNGGLSFVTSSLSGGAVGSILTSVNPMIWLILLYSALGPGTVADVVQQQGQSKLSSASEANVILSLEPVFAAVCAFLLLGETTTLFETAGGGLILLAALVATR